MIKFRFFKWGRMNRNFFVQKVIKMIYHKKPKLRVSALALTPVTKPWTRNLLV